VVSKLRSNPLVELTRYGMAPRIFISIFLASLCAGLAAAVELPCVAAERELRELAGDVPMSLWECARTSRVCTVLSYPEVEVLRAGSVRELPTNGSATLGIVQSGVGDQPVVCLVGIFSGGSAAAWLFMGWKIEGGRATSIEGMEKSRMNSDSVPPRALGNAIYGAYVRSRK
jgi:hypothetical protein